MSALRFFTSCSRASIMLVFLIALTACGIDPATRRVYAPSAPSFEEAKPGVTPSNVEPLDTEPPAFRSEQVPLPPMEDFTLLNGLRATFVGKHDFPEVVVTVVLDGGVDDTKEAIAGLAYASLLTGQPIEGVPLPLSLSMNGIRYRGVLGNRTMLFQMIAPAQSFATAMSAMSKIMQISQNFSNSGRIAELAIRSLRELRRAPQTLADREIERIMDDTRPTTMDLETSLRDASPKDVWAFVEQVACPQRAHLIITGDVRSEEAHRAVENFSGRWSCTGVSSYLERLPPPPRRHVILIDQPGATQATLEIGSFVGRSSRSEIDSARVLATVLGGMGGRLFRSLREENALSYVAEAKLDAHRTFHVLKLLGEFENTDVDAGIGEIFAALERLQNEPISQQELAAATSRDTSRIVASTSALAGWASGLFDPNETIESYQARTLRVSKTKPADVQQIAKKLLALAQLQIVVVGDAQKILEPLERRFGSVVLINAKDRAL